VKSYIYFLAFLFFLNCCNTTEKNTAFISQKHGDTLHINETTFTGNLNPHTITAQGDKNIAVQIFEGLVKYNPKNLTITPALCKYWVFSDEGKKYTFFLRTNAYFHKSECFKTKSKTRKITAADFKYSFEKLCNYQNGENIPQTMIDIVGAEEYFAATKTVNPKTGIPGIEVVNDSTLTLTIKSSNTLFINSLAELNMVIVAHEAIDKYGENNGIGCGPFYLANDMQQKTVILKRNTNYYFNNSQGKPLPYFDAIQVYNIKSQEKELAFFEQNKLDILCDISSDYIPSFLEKHNLKFKSESPDYIITKDNSGGLNPTYTLHHSYVKDFYTNRHNYIDYTRVYFKR